MRPSPDLVHARHHHAAARTESYLYNQLIPYIGNKRKLLPLIGEALRSLESPVDTFVDLFAGSSVVGRLAKTLGLRVIANDWEPYAEQVNRCFIGCNRLPPFAALGGAERVYVLLNDLPPVEDYLTRHLCPADDARPDPDRERMFYTRRNGMKMDAMREQIARWDAAGLLSDDERACLLASFVFAASYVSNTSGVFKGFHRGWGGQTGTALYRILSDVRLRPPVLHDNGWDNPVFRMDAQDLAETLRAARSSNSNEGSPDQFAICNLHFSICNSGPPTLDLDPDRSVAYLDPPYNQHPYGSNYHVLNTLVLWDKPPLNREHRRGDKAGIRTDWRTTRRSPYNHAADALAAYERLLQTLTTRYILTSYSTDGNIPLRGLLEAAARRGALRLLLNPYKRYRVSTQRMSVKPLNVEFVLTVDTYAVSPPGQAEGMHEEITRVEERALRRHPAIANCPVAVDGVFPTVTEESPAEAPCLNTAGLPREDCTLPTARADGR